MNLIWWHRHRLEVMRLVYSGEAEGEDVWGDLGAEEGLRPAPGRYQRSQRTTLPPYMSVAISNTSSAASILALLVPYKHLSLCQKKLFSLLWPTSYLQQRQGHFLRFSLFPMPVSI